MMTSTENTTTIARVMALGILLATLLLAIALSTDSAEAAVSSGSAYGWGNNFSGQLGNGTYGNGTDTNTPGAVSNLSGVDRVKAGCDHGLALKTNGTVWAWGYNYYGQLGNGNTGTNSHVPVKVHIDNVKAISAGCEHSLALKENGTVWAWGYNRYGELGDGINDDSGVPVQVANIGTRATAIAAGNDFSLALLKDGTVRSWGFNDFGDLGNGTSGAGTDKSKPVKVSNLSGVKAIATDSFADHALALLNDGTVKAWGDNEYGQLGNGASLPGTLKATPVRVANLSGVQAVATGGNHSLALMGSGRVKAWGNNYSGQLGNGSHGAGTSRSTPGNVIGLDNVRSISAGASHSLVVLQSGRARSWGYNLTGQLGNGTNGDGTDTDVSVAVKNLTKVKSIDGGYSFTLAATQ